MRFFLGLEFAPEPDATAPAAVAAPPPPPPLAAAGARFEALVEAGEEDDEDFVGVAVALPADAGAGAAAPTGALRAACVAARGTDILFAAPLRLAKGFLLSMVERRLRAAPPPKSNS